MSDFIKVLLFILAAVLAVLLAGPIVIFVGAILWVVFLFGIPVFIVFTGLWFIWFITREYPEEPPTE